MKLPKRFPYNPRWSAIGGLAVVFGAGAVLVYLLANHHDPEPLVNELLRLSPHTATVFYSAIFFVCAAFALLALLMAIRRIRGTRYLELGAHRLGVPHGLWRTKWLYFSYRDLTKLTEVNPSGKVALKVHFGARLIKIHSVYLPNHRSYIEVKEFLTTFLDASAPHPS